MKTSFSRIYIGLLLFSAQIVLGQCLVEPLALSNRIQQAENIVEGQVVAQNSFWNETKTHIFTLSKIQVYQSWKNGINLDTLNLLQKGGQVEEVTEVNSSSQYWQMGDYGLFFTQTIDVDTYEITNATTGMEVYQLYAGTQGFIPIDCYAQTANDAFTSYDNISETLYEPLEAICGVANSQKPSPFVAVQKLIPPSINSVFPLTVQAGMNETITIVGANFGTYVPNVSNVQFRNPDFFGLSLAYEAVNSNHIVSWTDNLIVVKVPGRDFWLNVAGAGTGNIRVRNNLGEAVESNEVVNVLYNRLNLNQREIDLIDDNGIGGYTLRFNNNLTSDAQMAFERALDTWKCTVNVNISLANTTTTATCVSNDGFNLVSFDDVCALPVNTLAETTHWYIGCGNGDAYYEEIDIVFNNNVAWNYSTNPSGATQKDFETIALHELGHLIGLGHVLNEGELMYPALNNGVDIRTPDTEAINCATVIMDDSVIANNCNGSSPMTALAPSPCVPSISGVNVQVKMWLQGADKGNTQMSTDLVSLNLVPNAQPFNTTPWNYTGTEQVTTLPNNVVDWVLVEVLDVNYNLLESRAAFLRNDGVVIDTNGAINVLFSTITANTDYHLIVRHRNHLALLGSNAVSLPNTTPYDFTLDINTAGTNQTLQMPNGYHALRTGDFNADGVITVLDFNQYTLESATIFEYLSGDCSLDGAVTVADYNLYQLNSSIIGVMPVRY